MNPSPETPETTKATTLITGATSGIGLHLAREFARHGHPLVIVAPIPSELEDVALRLRTEFNVTVHALAHDLRSESAAADIFSTLMGKGVLVGILVNNAGEGRRGKFWEIPIEEDISMIRLNIEAVIRLTKHFLPVLLQRGGGRILNTASVAGFEPGPLLAVYHATKAFVLSWSEALATELEDTDVTVTALCPGPVDTDFFPKADMIDTSAFQKANVMAPQEIAETAYEALMNGDRVVVPGAANKALVFARRILPESTQAHINQKLYQSTDADDRQRERGDIELAANDRS